MMRSLEEKRGIWDVALPTVQRSSSSAIAGTGTGVTITRILVQQPSEGASGPYNVWGQASDSAPSREAVSFLDSYYPNASEIEKQC